METIHEIDTIKMEKAKAMRRYRTFQKIANIFRSLELLLAVLLTFICISWTSSCIPTIIRFSGEFLRRLASVLFCPHFVFVLGNLIIITLFANSSFSVKSAEIDEDSSEFPPEIIVDAVTESPPAAEKVYRRSQSATAVEVMPVVEKRELRRSATVPRRSREVRVAVDEDEDEARRRFKEDELSNEEFKRKVESFIEKQRKFLSEETSMTLVLSK